MEEKRRDVAIIDRVITHKYEISHHKVSCVLEERLEFTLTYISFPEYHMRKIKTDNLIEEEINKGLKQRSKVIGIYPTRIIFSLCLSTSYGS